MICLLKYLVAEHALERITPAHNTSVVKNMPSEIGNTQKRVRDGTRQVCYVKVVQHAKRVNLQHEVFPLISISEFGVCVPKTWCVLSKTS